MGRTLTAPMLSAEIQTTYKFLARATVYPSRIFHSTIMDDYPWAWPEDPGWNNDPIIEDIEYSSTLGKLVTWYGEDGNINYQIQGQDDIVFTDYWSNDQIYPSVYDGKLFSIDTDTNYFNRYSIDYAKVGLLDTDPLTLEVGPTLLSLTAHAIHAVSQTEAVAICEYYGGFRPIYISGTSQIMADSRFVFPMVNDWDESDRTMADMGKFSGAAKLGNRIFVYMSAANTGMVQGMYYDLDTSTWSNIFIAVPTDEAVSKCEFRVTNVFERNDKLYMCGQFNRTDAIDGSMPYTLVLPSTDGITFGLGKNTLVSNLGYRFYAHVGSDGNFYIANSNRVCYSPVIWFFNGIDDDNSVKTELSMGDIDSMHGTNLDSMEIELKSGDGLLPSDPNITEGSKLVVEIGNKTTSGDEYVTYAAYIISHVSRDKSIPKAFNISCTHIALWHLTSLSMPFYAEMTGISASFDTFGEETSLLYSAGTETRYRSDFWVDLNCWGCEPWEDTDASITKLTTTDMYGYFLNGTPPFKMALVMKNEVRDQLSVSTNPTIISDPMTVKLYGWYYSLDSSTSHPSIEIMIIHTDRDGEDEQVFYSTEGKAWHRSYDTHLSGDDPIILTVTGIEVGRRIKKIGIVVDTATDAISTSHMIYAWRAEFTSGVSCPVSITDLEPSWAWSKGEKAMVVSEAGKPYIMFSQQPYNSFNFCISGEFENNVGSPASGFTTGVGLVALAEDGGNYLLAIYDKATLQVRLVKVRDGVETIVAYTYAGFSIPDKYKMQFSHRDGHFLISIVNPSTGKFQGILSTDWRDTYGFMFTSTTATMKVGIYGCIGAPIVETPGYSVDNSVGIPVLPLTDMSDFPSTGVIKMGGSKFYYTSKQALPSYVRGPSQAWNLNGVFPFGYTSLIYDFDLDGVSGDLATYLAAFTNTLCIVLTGANFTYYASDVGGFQVSCYISADKRIADSYLTTDDKVFVTGGFRGITQLGGDAVRFGYRQYGVYQVDGSLKCYWFMGSGGEPEVTTVQDMSKRAAALAGAELSFPGNEDISYIYLNGVEQTLFTDDYSESFDFEFATDIAANFELRTNVKIKPDAYDEYSSIVNDVGTTIKITNSYTEWYVELISTPSNTTMHSITVYPGVSSIKNFRIMYHGNCVSIFLEGRWMTTIVVDKFIYDQDNNITVKMINVGSAFWINSGTLKELSDPREAVYIDLETDGISAVRSIIQERPVEVIPQWDETLAVYYDYTRIPISMAQAPESHSETETNPSSAASDAIIYSAIDVKTLQFPDFAQYLGFSTKLFRFPNLALGAIEAAYRTLKKLFQQRRIVDMLIRPLLSLTPGDYLDYSYYDIQEDEVPGSMIVESIELTFTNADKIESSMRISGRRYD